MTVTAGNSSITVQADGATVTVTGTTMTVGGTADSVTASGNTGTVTTRNASISAVVTGTDASVNIGSGATVGTVNASNSDVDVNVDCTAEVGTITGDTETTGHNYTAVVTKPTCTAQGYTTYTCTQCGDRYVSDYTDAAGHSYNANLTACSTCGEEIVTGSVVKDMEVSNYTVIQYIIPYEDGTVTIVLDDARLKASSGASFAAFVSSNLINDVFMDVDGDADFTTLTASIAIDTENAEAIALGLTASTIDITMELLVQNGNEIQLTTNTNANLTADQLSALMVTDSTATTQNIPATSYLAGSGTKLIFRSDLVHLSDLVGTYNGDAGGYSTYLSSESYSGDGFTFYLAGGLRLKANYGGSSSYIALADFVKGVTVTSDGTLDTSNYDLSHNMYLDAYGYLIRMCG